MITRSGKIKITERLCTEWKTIGQLLDFDDYGDEVLKIEEQTKDMEDCLTKVLSLWLKGRSRAHKPATWKTFIELLKDSDQNSLASELERQLLQLISVYLYTSGVLFSTSFTLEHKCVHSIHPDKNAVTG